MKIKKSFLCLMSVVTILGTMTTSALGASTLVPPVIPTQNSQLAVTRIAGVDRVKTSVAVADAGWTQSDYAVIAYAWDFPDAVSAAPLAYKYTAPILLTDAANLNADTSAELTKLAVKHVLIVGGTGVVSDNVASQITALGPDVQRLSGADRYATSVAIAAAVGNTGSIVITNGYNPYEALSISPIAAKLGMPILLTARDSVPSEITNYLSQNTITQTYVLGKADGTTFDDGVADNSAFPNPTRITGDNLYQRNVNIIKLFSSNLNFSRVYLATGKAFADALAGSALAATTGSPLIFVDSDMPQITKDFLTSEAGSVTSACVLGGTGAISDNSAQSVEALLGSNSPKTWTSAPAMQIDITKQYHATIHTTMGDIGVNLFTKDAPITVNNLVFLASHNFYTNVPFHRIIKTFMIQTGDPTGTGTGGPGYTFADELSSAHTYAPGIVAMANAGPNTNGSQFFICSGADSENLDKNPNYTIFGQVDSGMDVVNEIANVPVGPSPSGEVSAPTTPVLMKSVEIQEK
ncbi:Peptidyl-prolyl cis-trans isomerase (modular protein) [Candidatus Desulfosporosinus infrequens]|uniref:peptidylprolyl isomerase n=1 Tax=Candidatus Desulfosporosinus infrequens TaxID=2043169 RepID=A0A2U3KX92_9FIRM|nr:Peptidyl-prolyl cis-trans isomerase (modular protein) [Candidatus Desulfosporosinus infrequens]